MADEADIAADYQAALNAHALAAHARKPAVEARAWCDDCGELIPHARRALGVATCVECQRDREAMQKARGK